MKFFLATTILFLSLAANGQTVSKFHKDAVIADLEILAETLKEAHYNAYAYTTAEAFESTYQDIKNSVVADSLDLVEATNVLQQLAAVINNGHTAVDFPGQAYGAYANSGGTVFPLEIAFENNIPLVRKNWSDNTNIDIGSELVSINGTAINQILSEIYPLISGERHYFKQVKLELFSFPRYYWLAFGKQDNFDVEIHQNGSTSTYTLSAVDLIDGFEMKRTELIQNDLKLRFYDNAAYLNPSSFGGDQEKYKTFIDSSFTQIKKRSSQNLIIDLRNNGGGDNSYSDYLVSYIADKPFQWHATFSLKTSEVLKQHVRKRYDTTQAYWKSILNHKNGEQYTYKFEPYPPQPSATRFNGNVYILINRQSHSQAAVTAAQIQDYGFGKIVGEETGDYPSLYASVFQHILPNTAISVQISKGRIVRVNGSTKEEGVIPDIFIKDYLLDERDEILSSLLDKIDGSEHVKPE